MRSLTIFVFVGLSFFLTLPAWAADNLVIISPHRKSIQDEFIPSFKTYYKTKFKTDVKVDWLDQGGATDDVRFLRTKFQANPKTSGVDVFWGGGSLVFLELEQDHLLAPYKLPAELKPEIPATVGGVPMYTTKAPTWVAQALSSYGIFYNKRLLKLEKLPEPKQWQDLAQPQLYNLLSLTDPRHSGTATIMNFLVLQIFGWDKGWQYLTYMGANAKTFTQMSSDPIKAVVAGDVAAAMAIDFYALAKIAHLGPANLGFVLPEGQSVLDPDPIAILKGAPNSQVAVRFMDYVLGAEAQKLWVLPKGKERGPSIGALNRMASNSKTYELTEGQRLVT